MSKMKDVYVIKVKTKTPLSSLYPSERRYSASTVGGLSLVHLGLSVLAFLLGTIARSLQGPVLSLACLFPFISGILAWRRWYIDKNISIFFYASLFSLVASLICGIATVFDITAASENFIGNGWRLEDILTYPNNFRGKSFIGILENDTYRKTFSVYEKFIDIKNKEDDDNSSEIKSKDIFNETKYVNSEYKIYPEESMKIYSTERSKNLSNFQKKNNSHVLSPFGYFNGFFFNRNKKSSTTEKTSLLFDINVLVTCVLEIFWSLLSIKISLRGMRNRSTETPRYENDNTNTSNDLRYQIRRVKSRAPNPGEQLRPSSSRNEINDEDIRNLGFRSTSDNSGPRLPLPESNKEFRERVERFLANQAAHRTVEGSCS